MKRKVIIIAMAVSAILLSLALTACGETNVRVRSNASGDDVSLDTCYALAVENGFEGTMDDFLQCIKGDSAYDIAVRNGFSGTEKEWLEALQGKNGMDGKSASVTADDLYSEAQANGFTGSYFDFLREYLNVNKEAGVSNDAKFCSVSVYSRFDVQYTTFTSRGYQTGTQINVSAGSGVIYSINKDEGSAYIVTNYHLVYSAESKQGISEDILVYLYGSETKGNEFYTDEIVAQEKITGAPDFPGMGIPATYVGGSLHYDIAVLYVENSDILKNSNAVAADFADSNDVIAGQTTYVVGNAKSKGISVTKGVVSVDSENLVMELSDNSGEYTSFRVMRVDAAINFGNSGGGVFDDEGKLIGIVNAKSTVDDVDNIGYALPSNVVKYVVENILYYKDTAAKNADVRKCMLGITISSRQSSAVLDENTGKVKLKEVISIVELTEGGLADGKLKVGDTLVSIKIRHSGEPDGVYEEYEVTRSFIIVDLMLTMRVGDTVTLTYDRTEGETTVRGTVDFVMTEECINEVN